jgi:hypothetical protein
MIPSVTRTRQELRTLLLIWWGTIVVPAIVIAVIANLSDTSGNAWTWTITMVGFVVQLFIFIRIQNTFDNSDHVAWMIAVWLVISLAPLATYAASAAQWWMPLVGAAWATLIAMFVDFLLGRTLDLRANGVAARGTVLDVIKPRMNVVVNFVYIKRRLRVRVERTDGSPPYEATFSGVFMVGEIPSPGDVLPLRVDPNRPDRITYDASAEASSTAGTPSASESSGSASPSRGSNTLPDLLASLADLRERGALTDDEFRAAKDKLLRGV